MTNLGKPPVKYRITLDKTGVASVEEKKKNAKGSDTSHQVSWHCEQTKQVCTCPYRTWCVSRGSHGTS